MKYKKVFILILLLIIFPINVDARSGCCSHHGGVSHCDTSVGKYRCNDGTISKTCVCEGTVQTTKRKTTKKPTTARPTTKRPIVKTTTTRTLPTTTSTTSYTTTVTTTEVIEQETSTTTMFKVVERASERISENVNKDNENTNEDTSPLGIIGGIGVIGAVSWYVAKKKKLV